MISNLLKTLTITATAGLLLACSTTQGVSTDTSVSSETEQFKLHSDGMTIDLESNGQATYTLNGKIFHWEDLTAEQQSKLSVLNKKIGFLEEQLETLESDLEPIIEEMELQVEQVESIVELIEIETEGLENIENMSIKEAVAAARELEEKVRAHESEIRQFMDEIRLKEAEVLKIEAKILGKEDETIKSLVGYIKEVEAILSKG